MQEHALKSARHCGIAESLELRTPWPLGDSHDVEAVDYARDSGRDGTRVRVGSRVQKLGPL